MTSQIHWRNTRNIIHFTEKDAAYVRKLSLAMHKKEKTMAFTMYEALSIQHLKFKDELELCSQYWWPYSVYMRWLVKKLNSRAINRIQSHYEKRMATIE